MSPDFFKGKKALVIDDSLVMLQSLRGTLRGIGFEEDRVHLAEEYTKALHLCRVHNYDLVLCDYNLMGGLDGRQIFEEIKHHKYQPTRTVFIMVTGESRRTVVNGIAELNPDDYILKPYNYKQLFAKIEKAMARRNTLLPVHEAFLENDSEKTLAIIDQLLAQKVGYQYTLKVWRGQLCIELKRAGEAKTLFEKLETKKSTVMGALGLANSWSALGNFEEADKILQQMLIEHKHHVPTINAAAKLHLEFDRIPSAVEYFELAAELSPANPDRELITANLCISARKFKAALGHYSRFLKLAADTFRDNFQHTLNVIRSELYLCRNIKHEDPEEFKERLESAKKRLAIFNQQQYKPEVAASVELLFANIALIEGNAIKAVKLMTNARKKCVEQTEHHAEDFYLYFHMAYLLNWLGFERQYHFVNEKCRELLALETNKVIKQSLISKLKTLSGEMIRQNNEIIVLVKDAKLAEKQLEWRDAQQIYLQIKDRSPLIPKILLSMLNTLAYCWPKGMNKQEVHELISYCDEVIKMFLNLKQRKECHYEKLSQLAWKNFGC